MSLRVHILPALKDNYIYALESESGECAVVDPGETGPVEKFLVDGRRLKLILCTHHHWDHTDGARPLASAHKAPIWCSGPDLNRIGGDRAVHEGESYDVLGEKMKVLAIPGHTLGQIGFWFPEMKALFAGDTLFSCGCGRLFEGTHEQMFASLAKIKTLPSDAKLYYGHEYTLRNTEFVMKQGEASDELTRHQREAEAKIKRHEPTSPGNLGAELKINPFLKAKTVEEFRRWREARNTF